MTTSYTCDVTQLVIGDRNGLLTRVDVYVTFPNTLGVGPDILTMTTTVELEQPESGEFVPFDDLSLEQIKQWAIDNGNIVGMIDEHIERVKIIIDSTNS